MALHVPVSDNGAQDQTLRGRSINRSDAVWANQSLASVAQNPCHPVKVAIGSLIGEDPKLSCEDGHYR